MAGQIPPQTSRKTFVEKDAHSGRGKGEGIAGFLKKGNRLIAADCWKIFEKVLQCVTSLEIIKQSAGGNAGSCKAGSSAHDCRVNLHDGTFLHVSQVKRSFAGLTNLKRREYGKALSGRVGGYILAACHTAVFSFWFYFSHAWWRKRGRRVSWSFGAILRLSFVLEGLWGSGSRRMLSSG